jgi:hypothetical protein
MRLFFGRDGIAIRLTDERRRHILEHPEMVEMEAAIEETLIDPQSVVQSITDTEVHLYYRFYFRTIVGGKFLCVVVKMREAGAFVLTAYLTARIKKGDRIWPKRENT